MILGPDAAHISDLLHGIDPDVALTDPRGDDLAAAGGSATGLWNLLDSNRGIGQTIASKIMARKRPALIPVQDGVVRVAVGWTRRSKFWSGMRNLLLTADDGAVLDRLHRLRVLAGVEGRYTDLRTFDIVTWMSNRPDSARRRTTRR